MTTYGRPARVMTMPWLGLLILQFGKFAIVGVTNAGISAGTDAGLLLVGTPSLLAAAVAFGAGAVNGYILNRGWTFAAEDSRRARITYGLVQLSALACTVGLVYALERAVPMGHFASYIAASVPVTVATFLVNRNWTFRSRLAR